VTTYRVQVEFPYFTNIPRDVAINTFHVTCLAGLSSGEQVDVCEAIRDFYTATHSGFGPLDFYMCSQLSRTTDACSVQMYDLDDAEPRPPIQVLPFTLGAAGSSSTLPTEVALCLSYHGTFPPGVPRARRRGRIYFGPLQGGALANGSAGTFPSPSANVLDALEAAATDLLAAIPAINALAFWSVWSRVNNTPTEIVGGWIDNAFDTQRRRGRPATSRSVF